MANATDVLTGVGNVLADLYPAVPVRTRKKPPGPDEDPLGGWTPADPCPCFVVSCPDPDEVDGFSSFETICVKYRVSIAYVKPALGGPAPQADDPDVRQKRQDIRDRLDRPTLTGVGAVWGVGVKGGDPYTGGAGGTPAVSAAVDVFEFLTNEPRGF